MAKVWEKSISAQPTQAMEQEIMQTRSRTSKAKAEPAQTIPTPAKAKASTTSSTKQAKGSSAKAKSALASTTAKKRARSTSANADATADEPAIGAPGPTKRVTRSTSAKTDLVLDGKDDDESDDLNEPQALQYKDDTNAFNTSVEDDKDFISSLPSETLDNILSYCILDHEPELAIRQKDEGVNFTRRPHVLLSLAAMSKHFRDHVESFSRREMTRNRDHFRRFETNAEKEADKPVRRSARLKGQPQIDNRCYRIELVEHLQTRCIYCGYMTDRWARMTNAVKCDSYCERSKAPATTTLTKALREYDLKDWMLLKKREPGPRAKKIDLPEIPYATVRTGTPLWTGMVIAHRFFVEDVQNIAELVHGDLQKHMAEIFERQFDRRLKRRRHIHRELKVRYHTDQIEAHNDSHSGRVCAEMERHQSRLTYYTGPDWDADGDSDDELPEFAYGNYPDVHSKLCIDKEDCETCWDRAMQKYHDWW